MPNDPILKRFLALLEAERAALRRGDLDMLNRLGPKKDSLAGKLDIEGLDRSDLAALDHATRRNQALLESAKTGLAAARDRIARIKAGAPMRTYSAQGAREDITTGRSTVQRRA
ncbi:hypothetical protein LX81_02649 [Palleronia aestuarii]|uniref:FlgN protein n=1 Tax=Palleronia aestuarii TaxID=568105 RepID=A0A2W7N4R0_9RHOB|nr:hypothetical protein [Palleronia aestuarii]PZX15060.1 hypothetical protein LX81_02649 [Palleronia aestuarii]